MVDEALKERYRKAMPLLAELLHMQSVFTGEVRLVENGTVNAKALGYIYGLTDAAFQIAKLDIASEYGMGVLMALIMEFDEPNVDMLWEYLKAPSDAAVLMDGVKLGGDDYNAFAMGKGRGPPLRWVKCFPQSLKEQTVTDVAQAYQDLLLKYPTAIVDVSALPLSKSDMKRFLKKLYAAQTKPEAQKYFRDAFFMLSQFQEGVGPVPVDGRLLEGEMQSYLKENMAILDTYTLWQRHALSELDSLESEWTQFINSAAASGRS
jgi:hypothetical protein